MLVRASRRPWRAPRAARAPGRHRAALAGVRELRHVPRLRRPRRPLQRAGGGAVTTRRRAAMEHRTSTRRVAASLLRPGSSGLGAVGSAPRLLVALGFVMVLNTSYFFAQERFGDPLRLPASTWSRSALGIPVMLVCWRMPTHTLRARSPIPRSRSSSSLLVAVLVPGIGLVRGGARRWIELGV